MSSSAILVLVLGLGVIAWFTARARAMAFAVPASGARPHSRPNYHGWYVALWVLVPACLFLAIWSFAAPGLVLHDVLQAPAAAGLPAEPMERASVLAEVRGLADGSVAAGFNPASEQLAPVYKAASQRYMWIGLGLAVLLAVAGGAFAFFRLKPDFRARTRVERVVMICLLGASLIAIFTTIGIVASLLLESLRFFQKISPVDFVFGLVWSPQTAIRADQVGSSGAFGAVPLFWGTVFIGAIIAMIVAIPLGLMSAIYLTQYARPQVRTWMKPILEILAGVPTVVYGYFAALTVAPALRNFAAWAGIPGASSESALAAGLVMGIMIIPFVSSMADDSIAAVPQSMRDGSLAMGATTSETIKRVLVPAALPGVVGGVLLAVSRAIGETMIVVMAAGLAANLTLNPFASVTTVTTQIVQLLTGDQEFDSAKTLAAFALGLVLFLVTLLLNIIALAVVKKYRESYE
ncbi:phosphate ABC transporter membrane protein 1, PhoT family [Sphingomonas sp. YR710]|uniref:phosphate ABC transporter permease subunit PstC n=1 Tax=Sphingomonas sp. YR710 TaxID=1882773 RepID=UPI00088ABD25|nr:phosphate ABC transporter permease subunit PstC [Sphingomonas sp. YR710]SDC87219.1 phosphate ABC transporter membrane protein 1, PhoT family [Sphingomonas sp. YR710]